MIQLYLKKLLEKNYELRLSHYLINMRIFQKEVMILKLKG